MAPIKLTYFDGRGRGEVVRLVLSAAKKPFEDIRIQFPDWPALKSKTPYGGLPMIEVGGKTFGQGMAIATFLAKENGLNGANNMEAFIIDQVMQLKEDLLQAEAKGMFEKDEAEKAKIMKSLTEETGPRYYGYFTEIIKNNPAKSGFVVGKKCSLGDLAIYAALDNAVQRDPSVLDKCPELKNLRSKVEETDGVKQYLAKRKTTMF